MKTMMVFTDGVYEDWVNEATGDVQRFVEFPVTNGRIADSVVYEDTDGRVWEVFLPDPEQTIYPERSTQFKLKPPAALESLTNFAWLNQFYQFFLTIIALILVYLFMMNLVLE